MEQGNLTKGDEVQFEVRGKGIIQGIFSHSTPQGLAYIHGDDNKSYERVYSKIVKTGEASTDFVVQSNGVQQPNPAQKFEINKRFEFLERLIRMTINKHRVSLIILGDGGLGKTYTVKSQLDAAHLVEGNDYKFVKGFSTAKGMYNTLYENNGKLIIFDDCDEVLKNDVARNILKGALDSYDTRTITWVTNNPHAEIPADFEFTGSIIFISNMSRHKIDNAILSRATNIDLTMSMEDKLARMKRIMLSNKFKPEASAKVKLEAFKLLEKYAPVCKNLNLRTLIEIIDFHTSGDENWKDLAEYVIHAG